MDYSLPYTYVFSLIMNTDLCLDLELLDLWSKLRTNTYATERHADAPYASSPLPVSVLKLFLLPAARTERRIELREAFTMIQPIGAVSRGY